MSDTASWESVQSAAKVLGPVVHRTPVLTSRTLDEATGCQFFLKAENFQKVGAFKFRGAYNALSRLPEGVGVVAFSSGNHAQAVACAARLQGRRATIVMPEDAPQTKLAATRGYGAEIVTYDRYSEDRVALSEQIAAEQDAQIIPPFDHPDIISGQGTAALELFDEVGELDALFVPCGGGGLLSGSVLAASSASTDCAVYGVEPATGDDVRQSVEQGRRVSIEVPRTIADGAQTTCVGEQTFEIIRQHAAGILTAEDDQLRGQMRFLAGFMKIVVEPTGCLGLAAARQLVETDPEKWAGRRIGIILSGGNVDPSNLGELLQV